MKDENYNRIKFLQIGTLIHEKKIRHFISTREGGISSGNYASLNLSMKVDDDPVSVEKNRKRIAGELGINARNLIFPDQCHTDNVQVLGDGWESTDLDKTDALITNRPGICLCVVVADCVPLMLFDRANNVIATVHAGWRGTASRIVSRTIELMIKVFATKPSDILAGIGPAISQQKFEVGDEVASRFSFLFSDHPEIISRDPGIQKAHIDLQLANRILLLRAGIPDSQIETLQLCTYTNSDLFFSARRDGLKSGRFGAGIMLV